MAGGEQLKSLVEQMPDPDPRGMYTENIDKERIEKAVVEIAREGQESVLGLIKMLGEPGSTENVKPHFALHCVVNYALIQGNEQLRKEICEVMAAQLLNEGLPTFQRVYLCQELQWAGRDEACPALGEVLLNENLTDVAATALAAIGGERAASQLRMAASNAKGKCRLNLIDALVSLADPQSAAIFQEALVDEDREVRIAAALGLAKVGRADGADLLFKVADAAKGWERTQITKACLILAEKLAVNGNKSDAKQIYDRLQKTRTGSSEQHIRDAAQRGLAAIA